MPDKPPFGGGRQPGKGRIWYARQHIARWLIHTGLRVMPPGPARQELTAMLWTWNMKIQATLAANGMLRP